METTTQGHDIRVWDVDRLSHGAGLGVVGLEASWYAGGLQTVHICVE